MDRPKKNQDQCLENETLRPANMATYSLGIYNLRIIYSFSFGQVLLFFSLRRYHLFSKSDCKQEIPTEPTLQATRSVAASWQQQRSFVGLGGMEQFDEKKWKWDNLVFCWSASTFWKKSSQLFRFENHFEPQLRNEKSEVARITFPETKSSSAPLNFKQNVSLKGESSSTPFFQGRAVSVNSPVGCDFRAGQATGIFYVAEKCDWNAGVLGNIPTSYITSAWDCLGQISCDMYHRRRCFSTNDPLSGFMYSKIPLKFIVWDSQSWLEPQVFYEQFSGKKGRISPWRCFGFNLWVECKVHTLRSATLPTWQIFYTQKQGPLALV